eukprot:6465581-Amphidinium_carterae.2
MYGLLNASEQTSLACKGHERVTNHVVTANDKRPRACLSMSTKGVKCMATGMQASAFAVLTWTRGGGRGGPSAKPAPRQGLCKIANHRVVFEERPAQGVKPFCNCTSKLSSQVFVKCGCEA